jgi:hypothetical protein
MHGIYGFGDCGCGGACRECGRAPYSPAEGLQYTPPVPAPVALLRPGAGLPVSSIQRRVLANQRVADKLFFSPAMPSAIAGNGFFVDANIGAPRSALSGLGGLNGLWTCNAVQQVVDQLKAAIVDPSTSASGQAVVSAQNFVDKYDGSNTWGECDSVAAYGASLLRALQPETSLSPAVQQAVNNTQTDINQAATDAHQALDPASGEMPLWGKVALIGGLSVAGIIGIAVITGQVAPLFRAVKKVVK